MSAGDVGQKLKGSESSEDEMTDDSFDAKIDVTNDRGSLVSKNSSKESQSIRDSNKVPLQSQGADTEKDYKPHKANDSMRYHKKV